MDISKVLEKVKRRLSITDDSKDDLLNDYIEEVQEIICNYCNIEVVSDTHINLVVKMVVDYYKEQHEDGKLKSISEGDTSTSYVIPEKMLEERYKSQFPPRKLRW